MQLATDYEIAYYRRIRGDGNCYYRAVAYGYIEMIVLTRNSEALRDLS